MLARFVYPAEGRTTNEVQIHLYHVTCTVVDSVHVANLFFVFKFVCQSAEL